MQVILFAVAFIAIGGSGQQVRAKVLTTSQGHHSKSKVCTDKICCFHSFLSLQLYLRELLIFTASEKGLKFCKLTKFRRVGGSWRRPGRVPGAGLVQPVVDPELHQASLQCSLCWVGLGESRQVEDLGGRGSLKTGGHMQAMGEMHFFMKQGNSLSRFL